MSKNDAPQKSDTETSHVCDTCGQTKRDASNEVHVTVAKSESAPTTPPRKHPLTWERSIEILKVLATVWVALVGTLVTMQFNERQHELNRIEAIAKMLPHVAGGSDDVESAPADPEKDGGAPPKASTSTKAAGSQPQDMRKDGAIWAIFRTANNKVMLRDLAALFPADIYRVVSSIAQTGELEHDTDAIIALQVASEKLATKFSADPNKAELAKRLYDQAIRLRERKADDSKSLRIVDITGYDASHHCGENQAAHLLESVNNLADLHLRESQNTRKLSASHSQAKELYLHARQMGLNNKEKAVQAQVARADIALAGIYLHEKRLHDAVIYLKEGNRIVVAMGDPLAKAIDWKAMAATNGGMATAEDLQGILVEEEVRLKKILEQYSSEKGVKIEDD